MNSQDQINENLEPPIDVTTKEDGPRRSRGRPPGPAQIRRGRGSRKPGTKPRNKRFTRKKKKTKANPNSTDLPKVCIKS